MLFSLAEAVREELVARRIRGDHRIRKFIENCIKWGDGWRFKRTKSLLSLNNALSTSPLTMSQSKNNKNNELRKPIQIQILKPITINDGAVLKRILWKLNNLDSNVEYGKDKNDKKLSLSPSSSLSLESIGSFVSPVSLFSIDSTLANNESSNDKIGLVGTLKKDDKL